MAQSILEMTKDLVKSQIEHRHLAPESIQQALQATHASLMSLKAQEDRLETGDSGRIQESEGIFSPVNWKKSIAKHAVTCLECGASFKQLSIRHLSQHDLNARSYREKYGIPRTQALSAKKTSARRREVAREIKPWEMTPWFLQAQAEKAKPAKKTVKGRGQKKATPLS